MPAFLVEIRICICMTDRLALSAARKSLHIRSREKYQAREEHALFYGDLNSNSGQMVRCMQILGCKLLLQLEE